jgi:hypothetical protein
MLQETSVWGVNSPLSRCVGANMRNHGGVCRMRARSASVLTDAAIDQCNEAD